MSQWENVANWVGNCLSEKVSSEKKSGWKTVWVRKCPSEILSEWEKIWVGKCRSAKLSSGILSGGYCRVGNCLGENVSSEKMTVNHFLRIFPDLIRYHLI